MRVQKKPEDPFEIGDIIEFGTKIGEIVAFLSDRRKSLEYILLDKRLEPLLNVDGQFKYGKAPQEVISHFDYSKIRTSKTFILGDIIKTESATNKYGVLVGFIHPDGLLSSSYEHGYNGIDFLECIQINKKDLSRQVNADGTLKRFQVKGEKAKICTINYFSKNGVKIIDE